MTLQISKLSNEHLPTVVKLLNEEFRNSVEFIPFTEEKVLSDIRKNDLKVLVATENREVQGVIATHTHAEEQMEEHVSWLAAREGTNYLAIENMLVSEIEKNANGNIVSTMLDEQSPRIADWINRGYTLHPGFQRMTAKLDGKAQVREVAEDVKLRSLKPGEENKFITVINAGFGWQRLQAGALELWKSEDPLFNEDWVQVAEIGERFASAVVARSDTDALKYLHVKRGYLGPAATLPEFRNKHLASALTARAMNFLFEKGMDSVRLGTSETNTSSVTMLRSLGFRVDVVRKILRKELKRQG